MWSTSRLPLLSTEFHFRFRRFRPVHRHFAFRYVGIDSGVAYARLRSPRVLRNIHRNHHSIPSSSFWIRCLSQWGSIDFQGQLFCLPADSRQTLSDFCLCPAGSKSEKNRGWGSPFGGNLMGKLKLWPQISRPLIIRGQRLGVGSTRGLGPYLTS